MSNRKLIMDNCKVEFEAALQEEAKFNLLMIENLGKLKINGRMGGTSMFKIIECDHKRNPKLGMARRITKIKRGPSELTEYRNMMNKQREV